MIRGREPADSQRNDKSKVPIIEHPARSNGLNIKRFHANIHLGFHRHILDSYYASTLIKRIKVS